MNKITLLLLFILTSFTIYAQNNYTYNFSTFNENYTNINNSTSLNNGMFWDDPDYTIPIGFDFEIAGKTISTLYLAEDISLGALVADSQFYNSNFSALALSFSDLIDKGNEIQNTSASNISYAITGNVGNRIFKLEWNNAGFYDDSTLQDFINLQLWLYEDTNIIEYRYGSSSIENPEDSYEGLSGMFVALFPSLDGSNEMLDSEGYMLSGNPSSPTLITITAGDLPDEPTSLNGDIPTGTVYRFTPNSNMSLDKNNLKSFEIYPNPSEDFIAINTEVKFLDYTIYNHLGKRVANGELKDKIEIANLASGIYFLELSNGSSKEIEKFIKK